ncbi:MAG: hypothetical protein ABIW38_11085 [Ferruginibacter sp.]
MKKRCVLLLTIPISIFTYSQNVGIGTTTPSEKLDVNGNVNINGILKLNNVEGNSGEVLMSGGMGQNPTWSSMQFLNMKRFAASSTAQSFTIPAGVSKIMIEGWSAGGNPYSNVKNEYCSAGSGAYVKGIINVSPGQVFRINVPLAQNTSFDPDTLIIELNVSNRLFVTNADSIRGGRLVSRAGIFAAVHTIDGEDGETEFETIYQNNLNQNIRIIYNAKGGNAPFGGNGGGGAKTIFNITTNTYASSGNSKRAAYPGGGGYYNFVSPTHQRFASGAGVLFIYY